MTKRLKITMSNHKIRTLDNLSLQEFDTDTELIPLLTHEDEEEMNNEDTPDILSILPLMKIYQILYQFCLCEIWFYFREL